MVDELTLVGYFPKATAMPDGWSSSPQVTEVYSVSDCVNSSPRGWMEQRRHNEWGFFNSPEDARSVVTPGVAKFTVLAYRLLPRRFIKAQIEPLPIANLPVSPIPTNFQSLGFDVVNKTYRAFFECSPLSCNDIAKEVRVNAFCLIDTLHDAIALADRFSREEPEPGPYFVLEVLRESPAA